MIKSYRIKTYTRQAIKLSRDKEKFIFDWTNGNAERVTSVCSIEPPAPYWNIRTLEGIIKAHDGDYLIKGLRGEFYSCKPDIFERTYEEVEND